MHDDEPIRESGACIGTMPLPPATFRPDPADALRTEAERTLRLNDAAHRLHARDAEIGWPPGEFYEIVGRGPMKRLTPAEVAEMERLCLNIC